MLFEETILWNNFNGIIGRTMQKINAKYNATFIKGMQNLLFNQ